MSEIQEEEKVEAAVADDNFLEDLDELPADNGGIDSRHLVADDIIEREAVIERVFSFIH